MSAAHHIETIALTLLVVLVSLAELSEADAETSDERRSQPIRSRYQTDFDRRHDRGALVRLDLGLSWIDRGSADDGTKIGRRAGIGFVPSLVVGTMPWKQVALHGGTWSAFGPGGASLGVGPGATYYFSEAGNTWVGAQFGPVWSSRGRRALREWGLGGEFAVGIFGWTGDRWSMGGSLFAAGDGVDLDGNGRTIRTWRVGLRLGLAYN